MNELKTIEELGVSPMPWKATGGGWVEYGDYSVDDMSGAFETFAIPDTEEAPANARLIAAAPELYEALFEAVGSCRSCNADCTDCINLNHWWMPKARAALAKAAGEEETK